uniref:Seipin n=2 Tax=Auxenochlorella protothecoides TaxID=3075 RepID=A0A1D1ZSY8_AUXPR
MRGRYDHRRPPVPSSVYRTDPVHSSPEYDGGAASSLSSLSSLAGRWASTLRSSILLLGSLACATLAVVGCLLLGYLLLTRALTPERHSHVRTLHLDFSSGDMLAEAVFLPKKRIEDEGLLTTLPRDLRFLPPGEAIDVSLELRVPGTRFEGGMVQAVAELQTADGRLAARTSSAIRLHGRRRSLWSFATAPYRWVGVLGDAHIIKVPLFIRYSEKAGLPFVRFKAALKSPHAKWVPEILSAQVRVNVRLGLVRGALYWIRPNVLLGLLLAAGAVCAAVGGSITSLVFLGLWIQSCGGRGKGPAVEPSAESQADEAELLQGHHAEQASDVDSEALEALLYDGEEVSAERVPKPAPDHDWHEVLSDPGCSASQVDGKAWDAHPFTDRSSPFEGMKSRDALRKRF